MKRAKPKKKPPEHKPARTPFEIVRATNYLNIAVMVRTLYSVYGWRNKRLMDFMESYIALMEETADHRVSIKQAVIDCYELTGINVEEFLDKVYRERMA